MKKVFTFIVNHLRDLVYIGVILLLLIFLSSAVRQCTQIKNEYHNNIAALKDTIHYYKGKDGQLIAFKKSFETDMKTLKLLNEDLYNQIQNMKPSGNVTSGSHFDGVIDNGKHDTAYIVTHDTIGNGFSHDFAFNNKFRTLEGNVNYKDNIVGVNLLKDEVYFDYTVAMDDKNNIYVTSSNPFVKYKQISGFQVPKTKQKRWSLGPSVGVGYDIINKKPGVNVGISLNYGILKF